MSYQWRRNGVPLSDGGRISGTTTSTLTINAAQPADTGAYDAQAFVTCSGQLSIAATSSIAGLGVIAAPPSPPSCPPSFSTPAFSAAGSNPYAAVVADLNSDGHPDAIISNGQSSNLSIMLGAGDGTFEPAVQYPAGFRPSAAAVADFNGDGSLDLVTANFGSPATMLLGQGDGTFSPISVIGSSGGGGGLNIAAADFDADGHPDLALTRNDNQLLIMLNQGNGTFGAASFLPTGTNPVSIAARDLNRDGRPDLVVATTSGAEIFLATGNGTFAADQTYSTGANPNSVVIDDVNNDGTPDVMVTNGDSANVSVLLGNGDGTFSAATNYSCGNWPVAVALTDINGDGRPDLAIANHLGPSAATILIGNGNGTFAPPVSFFEGDRPSGIAIGDFNRDSRPDLVLSNYWGNNVSVLLNTGTNIGFAQQPQSQSVAPGTSVALSVTVSGSGPFTYQWRRNGVPIPGATTPDLFLGFVGPAHTGSYDVQVRGGCNSAAATTSEPAVVWVENPLNCPADFNLDGGVDGSDVAEFFFRWESGC